MTRERMKVLSIVGPGRSGTTILASIMGEVDGVFSTGELRWFWQRGLLEGRTCGCGLPPTECEVWSAVLSRLVGDCGPPRSGDVTVFAARVVAAQRAVAARSNRLRVIRSVAGGAGGWDDLQHVRSATADVFSALSTVTGARLVIDTSKRAQDAAIVAALDDVDHYVLHIVRDPRAVAYSWSRRKSNPAAEVNGTMLTRGASGAVSRWTENCVGAEVLKRYLPGDRWMSLRYEDFVAAPRWTIGSIFAFLGMDVATPFSEDRTVVLGRNHTVAGNPNRFRTGAVTIVDDDEWRTRLARQDRMRVAAVAFPLMLRYRYSIRPRISRPIRG